MLVSNPGLVVEKDRLLREVWAESFVEEGSLSRTIHELRRALDSLFVERLWPSVKYEDVYIRYY